MRTLKLTKETIQNILTDLLKRSPNNYTQYESSVNEIIANVRSNGDQAVFDYTQKFDGATVTADNIEVTEDEIAEAYELVDQKLLEVTAKQKKTSVFIMKSRNNTVGLIVLSLAPCSVRK